MTDDDLAQDYYETLQISPNAEPETIHRIFRLLAQRFHPDNQETGDSVRFRPFIRRTSR
jgi:DnaJ-class molecular chaperone